MNSKRLSALLAVTLAGLALASNLAAADGAYGYANGGFANTPEINRMARQLSDLQDSYNEQQTRIEQLTKANNSLDSQVLHLRTAKGEGCFEGKNYGSYVNCSTKDKVGYQRISAYGYNLPSQPVITPSQWKSFPRLCRNIQYCKDTAHVMYAAVESNYREMESVRATMTELYNSMDQLKARIEKAKLGDVYVAALPGGAKQITRIYDKNVEEVGEIQDQDNEMRFRSELEFGEGQYEAETHELSVEENGCRFSFNGIQDPRATFSVTSQKTWFITVEKSQETVVSTAKDCASIPDESLRRDCAKRAHKGYGSFGLSDASVVLHSPQIADPNVFLRVEGSGRGVVRCLRAHGFEPRAIKAKEIRKEVKLLGKIAVG